MLHPMTSEPDKSTELLLEDREFPWETQQPAHRQRPNLGPMVLHTRTCGDWVLTVLAAQSRPAL